MPEQVLVLPRSAVPGGCDFLGLRPAGEDDVAALRAAIGTAGIWMERAAAEEDSAHKQVIPYVVVRDRVEGGDGVFLMERSRAGGDARLHRRATIGVGGHLNPDDAFDGSSPADPLAAGLHREWREELEAAWEPDFTLIGFLNDDRNPVGAVHLGIVFVVDAAGRRVAVREHHKLSGRMIGVQELWPAWERLETWSQLVAESLWARPRG